jgi:hypothetical protein
VSYLRCSASICTKGAEWFGVVHGRESSHACRLVRVRDHSLCITRTHSDVLSHAVELFREI